MANVGDTFRTGETAPDTGRYDFLRHIDSNPNCTPTPEERSIRLSRGETFPPHRSCNKGVVWRLASKG